MKAINELAEAVSGQKYHVYDPGYSGTEPLSVHDTLEEAIAAANDTIKHNWAPDSGDEWSLDVEDICVVLATVGDEEFLENGTLLARAKPINMEYRPEDTDEDGWSVSAGDHWAYGSCESVCNYAVLPVAETAP